MTVAGRASRKKAKTPWVGKARDREAASPDAAALLAWYDRHRRDLPWRARPGGTPDPYRVWLSEIMLQQTTVRAVAPYYARFLERFPTIEALAAAPLEAVLMAWAGLGYYARARNLHACARAVVALHGGRFPDAEDALRALPGIGPYTAAAIAAIAFDRRASPVDGNVERVIARLYAIEEPLPAAKPVIRQRAEALAPARRSGDFAQAMMDLGATICTPKPACIFCPWNDCCVARRRGDPERFPRKVAKPEGRLRRGAAFVAVRADGFVLLRSRAERGLLGGMSEVPTTEWVHEFDEADALDHAPQLPAPGRPSRIEWRRIPAVVRHTFTHFPLELVVYKGRATEGTPPTEGARWVAIGELDREALPNVMRKVLMHADPLIDNPPNTGSRRKPR
jgi:A/G-specific adenine glycosylase